MTQQERVSACKMLRTTARVAITHKDKNKALDHLCRITKDAQDFNINPTLVFVSDNVFNDRVKEGSV